MLRSRAVIQSSKRFVSTQLPAKIPQPVKQGGGFKSFVGKALLVTATTYAVGTVASHYNDQVEEMFVDHVPFGEEIVTMYDNLTELMRSKGDSTDAKTLGEKIQEMEAKKISQNNGVQAKSATLESSAKKTSDTPAIVVLEPKKNLPSLEQLNLSQFELPASQAQVPELAELVSVFNTTIDTINKSDVQTAKEAIGPIISGFKQVQDTLHKFGKFTSSTTNSEEKRAELEKEFGLKAVELQKKLTTEFIEKLNSFEKTLTEQSELLLNSSIKTNEEALKAKQANQITLLSIKQVEQFNKILKEKLDLERDGRLSKLNELNDSVKDLSQVVHKLDKYVITREASNKLMQLIGKLQKKLLTNKEITFEELNKNIANLKLLSSIIPSRMMCNCKNCKANGICECGCSRKTKLMDIAISELELAVSAPSIKKSQTLEEAQKAVLSNEQLYNRWFMISEQLQTASLLPENAGILGQFSAKIFSKLLFTKSGAVSNGESMEDVIARVGEHLKLSKLDAAVEEVTQLQGWSRIVVDDWLQSARLKLEVQTLIDVIDSDAKSL
ncbi:hypothetical protein ACO0RG_004485 [Hanseniaspora osmophila]